MDIIERLAGEAGEEGEPAVAAKHTRHRLLDRASDLFVVEMKDEFRPRAQHVLEARQRIVRGKGLCEAARHMARRQPTMGQPARRACYAV